MRWKDLELHPEPHTMKRASSFSASISVSWGSVKNALLVLGPVMPRVSAICWSMIRLSISHQPRSSQSVKSFKIPSKIFKILSGIAWIYSANFSLKEHEPRVKFWSCQNSVLHELFLSLSLSLAVSLQTISKRCLRRATPSKPSHWLNAWSTIFIDFPPSQFSQRPKKSTAGAHVRLQSAALSKS